MLDVDSALRLVLEHASPKAPARVPLAQALGLVLAENVTSDVDSPPHDKAVVDGYAVVAADVASGRAKLRVLEEVTAGQLCQHTVVRGTATRIMTGAPLPAGADAVVMIERTQPIVWAVNQHGVFIEDDRVRPGMNIMRRATSLRRGQEVLTVGKAIRPIEVGLLAEVGRAEVLTYPRPTVALLSTGNELVPASTMPSAGQIRNSNSPMLAALVTQAGGIATDLGIARDQEQELSELVTRGLACDVLVLSGGVSAGVLDLVPGVLSKLGVKKVFHKVNLKPGKPIWFGVLPEPSGQRLVFGLPGNPVSTLVCFHLFVRPALAELAGGTFIGGVFAAPLSAEFEHRGDRPTYFPARVIPPSDHPSGPMQIELLDWQGSGDLRTLTDATCLAHFPASTRRYRPGESIVASLLE